jgi:hypothetical protein
MTGGLLKNEVEKVRLLAKYEVISLRFFWTGL